jgi:hypothetical protein
MRVHRFFALGCCVLPLAALPATATNLVTGNGFGFAVVSPESGALTKFYPHPYSFVGQDPQIPLGEGIPTANFIEQLAWAGRGAASTEYLEDSHIIHVHRSDGDGLFFMPFGLHRAALVISWERPPERKGFWVSDWTRAVGIYPKEVNGSPIKLVKFDGLKEEIVLIPFGPMHDEVDGHLYLSSSDAWALLPIENDADLEPAVRDFNAWRAGLSLHDLVQRELAELEQWRAKPPISFASDAERHLWRQSEVMLRMAQSREPNTADRHGNGLIVASLPDGVWFTPWVRDMAWATVALARMGHQAEARAALLAYFNAQPTGKMCAQVNNADYQISVVRYWGNGAEEPFFTEEGTTNIEFDDWGEALWVLGEYLRKYDDPALLKSATFRGALYPSARDFIVRPLLANLEPFAGGEIVAADTSIWEEHQKDKKHFAFSTAMAIVGLREFAEVAHRSGDESARTKALHHVALLQKGFAAAFIRGGHLHGTLEPEEKNDIDGALLAIIHFGVVTDPGLVRDTVQRMELLKVASGGYRRVRSNYTDPAIFEYWYEREEFVFVDFELAAVLRTLGRTADAAAIESRIESKAAADHDILPEMYVALPCKLFPGAIGDPTGARPMVGYGAGEFILDLLDRANLSPSAP